MSHNELNGHSIKSDNIFFHEDYEVLIKNSPVKMYKSLGEVVMALYVLSREQAFEITRSDGSRRKNEFGAIYRV